MVFPVRRAIIVVDLKSLFVFMCYQTNVLNIGLKEGRQIGRGEFYITAHTRKNGQPIDDYSFEKIVCCFLSSVYYLNRNKLSVDTAN